LDARGIEPLFYSRQLEALAKGQTDLISYALKVYRKITESLMMYEREVELAKRDSGQLIPRADAERGAGSVAADCSQWNERPMSGGLKKVNTRA